MPFLPKLDKILNFAIRNDPVAILLCSYIFGVSLKTTLMRQEVSRIDYLWSFGDRHLQSQSDAASKSDRGGFSLSEHYDRTRNHPFRYTGY